MGSPEVSERLVRDVFPGEILMPDGSIHTHVRVFVTTGRLLAYKVDEERRILPVLNEPVQQPVTVPVSRGSLVGQLEVRLKDGSTAWVNRGHGCGCGSPLKAFAAPFDWA